MNDEMKFTNHNNEDQEIMQLLEMLSQLPEAPVPDEFDLRLRRALKEENAKRREEVTVMKTAAMKPVWKKWTAMAACLMVGLLSFQMIQVILTKMPGVAIFFDRFHCICIHFIFSFSVACSNYRSAIRKEFKGRYITYSYAKYRDFFPFNHFFECFKISVQHNLFLQLLIVFLWFS